jgi:hypothetical protein
VSTSSPKSTNNITSDSRKQTLSNHPQNKTLSKALLTADFELKLGSDDGTTDHFSSKTSKTDPSVVLSLSKTNPFPKAMNGQQNSPSPLQIIDLLMPNETASESLQNPITPLSPIEKPEKPKTETVEKHFSVKYNFISDSNSE